MEMMFMVIVVITLIGLYKLLNSVNSGKHVFDWTLLSICLSFSVLSYMSCSEKRGKGDSTSGNSSNSILGNRFDKNDGEVIKEQDIDKFKAVTDEKTSDGFVWRKVRMDNLYGAEDIYGNTILPPIFSNISYQGSSNLSAHLFFVKKSKYVGVYKQNGESLIPIEDCYNEAVLCGGSTFGIEGLPDESKNKYLYWKTRKGNYCGLIDANGYCVISPDRGYSSCVMAGTEDDGLYIRVRKNGYEGICNLYAEEVIKPNKYDKIWVTDDDCIAYVKGEISGTLEIPKNMWDGNNIDYICPDDYYYSLTDN